MLSFSFRILQTASLIGILLLGFKAHAETDLETLLNHYQSHLLSVKQSKKPVSLEPLYNEGQKIIESSLEPKVSHYYDEHRHEKYYNLEGVFNKSMAKLEGFTLSRYEGSNIILQANYAYWKTLAKQKGTDADRVFFYLMDKTYPYISSIQQSDTFPQYILPTWDYGGCTKYGTTLITQLYRDWLQFKRKHPNAYQWDTNNRIDALYDAFHTGYMTDQTERLPIDDIPICSCKGKDAFYREINYFLKTLPNDKIAPNLRQFKKRTERKKLKFECNYG